jgi:putative ABC transport system substrate-binding protein
MKRREFLVVMAGAAAVPFAAHAQQGKLWRIGFIETIAADQNAPNMDAFRSGMREHRYIEGQNFVIEYRSAEGRVERYPLLASELVRLNVDVIVTRATPAVVAAKKATSTIPIVMAASGDPLGTGVVASLARPGGNVTGLNGFTTDLLAKRVEILREAVPGVKRIGLVHNMSNPVASRQWEELKAAAPALGIEPLLFDARSPHDLPQLFEADRQDLQGRQARRAADRAAGEVRSHRQPQDGKDARPRRSGDVPDPCRRGVRVVNPPGAARRRTGSLYSHPAAWGRTRARRHRGR